MTKEQKIIRAKVGLLGLARDARKPRVRLGSSAGWPIRAI
jgi:hypothetical protein